MKRTVRVFLLGFLLFAGLAAAARLMAPSEPQNGHKLQNPIVLGEFNLHDAKSGFTAKDLKGHWSILSFGYSHCPDVCPATLAYFRDELKRLPKDHDIAFLFVSVDPERDDPQKLAEYVAAFDPTIRGLTGKPDDVKRLAETVHTNIAKEGDGEAYKMAHTPRYFLINPEGNVVALYTPPLAPGALSDDLRLLMRGKGLLL